MILINDELYAELQRVSLEHFIQRKLDHYANEDHVFYDYVGEDNYRKYIESSISKSRKYGMDSEVAINTILSMMDYLGHKFDTDPQYGWARIIKTNEISDSMQRVESIHKLLGEYIQGTVGESASMLKEALSRFLSLNIRDIVHDNGDDGIVSLLCKVYPEKFYYFDESKVLDMFLPIAKEKALQSGFKTSSGVFLMSFLMLMLGASFDTDPRYQHVFSLNSNFLIYEEVFLKKSQRYFTHILNGLESQYSV